MATQNTGLAARVSGAAACGLALAWMVGVQAAWFRTRLGIGRLHALALGLGLVVGASVAVVAALSLLLAF